MVEDFLLARKGDTRELAFGVDTYVTAKLIKHHQPLGTGVAQHGAHPSAVFATCTASQICQAEFYSPPKRATL